MPNYVDDRPAIFFRIRIENQTLIMAAIIQKMLVPKIIGKIPDILQSFDESVIINIEPADIKNMTCIMNHIHQESIYFYNPPAEMLDLDWEYIPSLDMKMQVYRWDRSFRIWLIESLMGY